MKYFRIFYLVKNSQVSTFHFVSGRNKISNFQNFPLNFFWPALLLGVGEFAPRRCMYLNVNIKLHIQIHVLCMSLMQVIFSVFQFKYTVSNRCANDFQIRKKHWCLFYSWLFPFVLKRIIKKGSTYKARNINAQSTLMQH